MCVGEYADVVRGVRRCVGLTHAQRERGRESMRSEIIVQISNFDSERNNQIMCNDNIS